MKKQSNFLFSNINTQDLIKITTVVKETLHLGHGKPAKKIFSAADMWNIQRQKKATTLRRLAF